MKEEASTTPRPPKRRLRLAIQVSVVVHVVLLAALGAWHIRRSMLDARTSALSSSGSSATEAKRQPPTPESRALERLQPKPGQTVDESIRQNVERVVVEGEGKTPEVLRDELDEQLDELTDLSSEESLEALASHFHKWMETTQRETRPATDPVEGSFDFDTAQIDDVLRQRDPDGQWRYVAVMFDAEGRTTQVDLSAEEGADLHATFQRIKKNPLAEKIYREMTIPLLDKLLTPSNVP